MPGQLPSLLTSKVTTTYYEWCNNAYTTPLLLFLLVPQPLEKFWILCDWKQGAQWHTRTNATKVKQKEVHKKFPWYKWIIIMDPRRRYYTTWFTLKSSNIQIFFSFWENLFHILHFMIIFIQNLVYHQYFRNYKAKFIWIIFSGIKSFIGIQ